MTLPLLIYRSLRQHALSTIITAGGIALACGLLMCVWMVKTQSQSAFTQTNTGFDAVLGARGSKLQLVLNAIFHLEASPGARVIVVAHNAGIEFLLAGARDAEGVAYRPAVAEFVRRGVEFRVCGNTLTMRGLGPSRLVPEATLVPSGIAEISRLQAREGFAYLRL